MTYEILARSRVLLSAPVRVRDIQEKEITLNSVGDAWQFIHDNFSIGRRREDAWRAAAKSLQMAAATNFFTPRENATKLLIALLQTEGMMKR